MFATALKDLAVELDVSMMTSTQVNANADSNNNIRNESSLAGGRSTINKADNGCIIARPTKDEIDLLKTVTQLSEIPNMVTDVYKVRSGEWSQIRIWSIVDLGTMRKKDLFVTDERLDPIEGFFDSPSYKVINWSDEEEVKIMEFIEGLNDGIC